MARLKSVTKGVALTIRNVKGVLKVDFMLNGKRVRKSLRMKDTPQNRKIAQTEIIPLLQTKIARGEYGITKEKVKTFGYYADFFLKQKENENRSFMTKLPTYEKVIEFFKNYPIDQVTRFLIKQYMGELKMKPTSKRIYLSAIREVLELAIDDGTIQNNPSLNIKLGTTSKPEIAYFQKEEMYMLIAKANEPLKTYLLIAFSTGMRHEEILGLKFSDIKNGLAKIQRSKSHGKIDITKTENSTRTIPFNIDVEHLKEKKSFYLYPDINDISYFRKSWKTLLEKCNIQHRGIKNTRHTFATHFLKDKIGSINELSGLLGHTKVSTTLTFYASVIDPEHTDIGERLKNSWHDIGTLGKPSEVKKA